MEKNILFISHDRSGSNLMRSILSQHPSIYIVPALPLFEQLYWWMDAYGNLQDDKNWEEFLQDLVELTNANHHPIPRCVTVDEVRARATGGPRSLGAATQVIYGMQVESQGTAIGGIKFGAHLSLLEPFFDQTQFTHVIFNYRDPRDVAISTVKAGVNPDCPSRLCKYWAKWHCTIRRLVAHHDIPSLETRYEDLLVVPERTLDRLWTFLEVPAYEEALDFHRQTEQIQAAQTSYMWRNLSRPLMRENYEKFYAEWNPFAIRRLERALGSALQQFGYQPAEWLNFQNWWRKPSRKVVTDEDRSCHKEQEVLVARIQEKYDRQKKLKARNAA